jgi:ATP phosphoribosyltransferase regulatory subunit
MSAEAAFERIAAAGGARIEPPTLLPASLILDLSGEAVRSRLCTFTTDAGEEYALRPDLTTPIASKVAAGELTPSRYCAMGAVYRLPPVGTAEPVEHVQAGFEWFGGGGPEEDAEALVIALEAAKAGGAATADVRFGDVALYRAVVEALDFTPRWKQRLVRAFAHGRGPRELLAGSNVEASALAQSLATLSESEAVKVVEEMFAVAGVQPVGGRGPQEIAERLRDKAGDTPPPTRAAELLVQYLELNSPAAGSIAAIEIFAKAGKLDLSAALAAFKRRLDRIEALKPPFWDKATFGAEVGRRFDYYDGFVFELSRGPGQHNSLGGGGRYDNLLARLSGGKVRANAIGAGLRIGRLGGAS